MSTGCNCPDCNSGTGGNTGDKGFALLEVLVALSASALILTLYFQVIGRSAEAKQIMDDRLTVAAFAQSKLDSIGIVEPLKVATTEGRFGDIYHWRLDVADDAPSTDIRNSVRLWKLTLSVQWERDGMVQGSNFTTLRIGS